MSEKSGQNLKKVKDGGRPKYSILASWIGYVDLPGAGENTLRRLALFVYLDHPTKNDVTSGKKVS